MKKLLFSLIFLFIGLALFFQVSEQVGWQEIKKAFSDFSAAKMAPVLFLGFLAAFIGNLRWRKILKSKGYFIPLKDLFGHYLASFAITYLVPMVAFGGEAFRGYILKGKNGVSFEKGMAASFIDGIFEYVSEWLIIFLGLTFFFLKIGLFSSNPEFVFLFFLLFLAGSAVFVFIAFRKKTVIKLFFHLDDGHPGLKIEKDIFDFFNSKNPAFQTACILSLAKIFTRLTEFAILVNFLGESVSLASAFAVLGVSVLAMAPPVSADIGTHDFVSVFLFKKLQMNPAKGAAFASAIRGVNLFLSLVGLFFLIKFSLESLRDSLFKKAEKLSSKINRIKHD